ncbi:ParB/RepB/Spo0J family partition protein [Desulfococcaceae bacterium HSG8]|nr:ParB/RepB/Spo0J family partition protein [Desulfococcaceae bacterium HSG8]
MESVENHQDDYFNCDIGLIRPNPYQPRKQFSQEELTELCSSVREQGIIQPLLVRSTNPGYEIIAGERRFRAAEMAGLETVPVILKNVSDSDMLAISIIENIQRKDLNPLEESEAYHRLMTEFTLTQDQVAKRVGKSRSAVANILRLRQLPLHIRDSVTDGVLSMGHARALLGAETPAHQTEAWQEVLSKGLSVRQTENLISRLKRKKKELKKADSDQTHFSDIADDLSRQLGTKVQIRRSGKRGKIEIEFYTDDDLDYLINILKTQASGAF